MTMVSFLFSLSLVRSVCLHFLSGKNQRYKKWFIGIHEAERAVTTALAPGIGETSYQAAIASRTSAYQGSEIHGVPASEIRATSFPFFSISSILSVFAFPECE
jgi:hypothetical protein